MGYLDGLLGAPGSDQSQALGLLAAGLVKGDFGGGLLAANNVYSPESKLKRQLLDIQAQQGQLSLDETRRRLADEDATRKVLQGIYGQQGLPQSPTGPAGGGGPGAMPQGAGAPQIPQSAGVPQQSITPKADVWQQYKTIGDSLAARGLVTQAQQYYGLAEKMRPKFSTEPRVLVGPDGKLVNVIVGEDGSTQVLPFGVKPQIKLQDLGGRVVAVDENSLNGGQSFDKTQTPDSAASVAATLRGQNLTDARSREANQNGRIPAGYRQTADGSLEYIPGGPADPNAAKRAAPTEFQGKSAAFGARAQEADKIIRSLTGQYSPVAVNTKVSLENTPLIGGPLGALANTALSANSQRAEQAQRDFVNAVLRQESGAAISQGEFENAKKQYFPQPGDSREVISQKERNRAIAIQGFRENSRPGAVDAVAGVAGSSPTATPPQAAVNALRMNPRLRADFDAKYGPGAADRALGR